MKKRIVAAVITACLALCAAVWPQPEPTPPTPQPTIELQPGDEVYIPGFGWVPYEGPNHREYAADMYENGNKIGSMG